MPVYNATHQIEPQFLVINLYGPVSSYPVIPSKAIDLRNLNETVQLWSDFHIPVSMPLGEGLKPSCRTRGESKKLVIAGIASGIFGFIVVVFLFFWRWRKRRLSQSDADQISPKMTLDGEHELTVHSKNP